MTIDAHFHLLADSPAALLPDSPMLTASVTKSLRQEVSHALRHRSVAELQRILDESATFEAQQALRWAWIPIAMALDTWSAAGTPLSESRGLARALRSQVRSAQLSLPALPVTCWLVPATEHDTTAAHLAVLALSLRGIGAGVWAWSLPPPGHALLVGDASSPLGTAGRIPPLSGEPSWPSLGALVA